MDARCALCKVNPGVIGVAGDRPELLCARCAETIVGFARLIRTLAAIVVDALTSRTRRHADDSRHSS